MANFSESRKGEVRRESIPGTSSVYTGTMTAMTTTNMVVIDDLTRIMITTIAQKDAPCG